MIDAAPLTANRETDKLVAEALGWREVAPPALNGPVDLVGIPPGAEKQVPVPFYSSSTAALLALEEWQKNRGNAILFSARVPDDERKWAAHERLDTPGEGAYFVAPTLWLAIAKLIVAMGGTT